MIEVLKALQEAEISVACLQDDNFESRYEKTPLFSPISIESLCLFVRNGSKCSSSSPFLKCILTNALIYIFGGTMYFLSFSFNVKGGVQAI